MKRIHKIRGVVLSLAIIILIAGCGGSSSSPTTSGTTGIMSLSITDAPPQLRDDVTAVNIRVIGIEYHHDGNWTEVENFVPQTFNLLDLQNGKSLPLGDFELPAGHYTQIRFMLAIPEKVEDVKSNPDCNITFEDNSSVPLFVPSGGQSGYKGIGEFDIIADANVSITADWDVGRSVVVTGNEKYLLKPVIRLVVTELSGKITGTVVDVTTYGADDSLVVYAYENDADIDIANEVIEDSEGIRFPNAVTSGDVNMNDGNFTLSFLGEGNYSLVTANYTVDADPVVVDMEEDVEVLSGEAKRVDLNTSDYIPL